MVVLGISERSVFEGKCRAHPCGFGEFRPIFRRHQSVFVGREHQEGKGVPGVFLGGPERFDVYAGGELLARAVPARIDELLQLPFSFVAIRVVEAHDPPCVIFYGNGRGPFGLDAVHERIVIGHRHECGVSDRSQPFEPALYLFVRLARADPKIGISKPLGGIEVFSEGDRHGGRVPVRGRDPFARSVPVIETREFSAVFQC